MGMNAGFLCCKQIKKSSGLLMDRVDDYITCSGLGYG